jgi:hypothetical protein
MSEKSLAGDLKTYFEFGNDKDVIIKTDPVITAHSQILRARSEYFTTLLSKPWATIENNSYIINCSECSYTAMYKLILYLYTDNIDLNDLTLNTIIEILNECDKFMLNNLSEIILEFLYPLIKTLSKEDITTLLNFTVVHETFHEYCKSTFKLIMSEFKNLGLLNITTFTENTIQFILKRDDLNLTEGELIKFIKDNYYTVELEDLRLNQIENEMVMDLLWQEHTSQNKYILEDLLRKKLDPGYITKYGIKWLRYSNINHMSKILKTYNIPVLETIFGCSVRMELVFSSSRIDRELTSEDIFNVCKDKCSLLVIGKGCRAGYMLGAYNDNYWINGSMKIENSFLFKMSTHETGTYQVAKPIIDNKVYVHNNLDTEIAFGHSDLILNGYCWRYNVRSYDHVFASGKWDVDVIKFYQIYKHE